MHYVCAIQVEPAFTGERTLWCKGGMTPRHRSDTLGLYCGISISESCGGIPDPDCVSDVTWDMFDRYIRGERGGETLVRHLFKSSA